MSWTVTSNGESKGQEVQVGAETGITLPASATIGYSSAITHLAPDMTRANKYVMFGFNPSAVTGTNLDIALYGSMTETGTKFLLKDEVVSDITATGLVFGQVDLNAYPCPYYFLAWTADGDESANTIDVYTIG